MNLKTLATFLILLFLFATGIFIRLSYYQKQFTGFVPYSAESASHYYYAKRIQAGFAVPQTDASIQHPEGLKVFRKTSIFMEYVTAWLYNHFFAKAARWDFHFFTRFSMPFFYLFSIFALFICGTRFTGSRFAALTACALFVFSRGAMERSSGFEFLSENFSLPFIFFHFAFASGAFQREKKSPVFFLLSGAALSVALCSWKISQFYLLVFSVFLLSLFLFSSETKTVQTCALVTSAFCVVCGLAAPYLQEGKFLLSAPCLLLYFLSLSAFGGARLSRMPARFSLFILAASAAAAVYFIFLPPEFRTSMYSHVYGMFFYKLKFVLQKPVNASLLPPDVRAFWVPPFFSPSLQEMLNAFPLLLPVTAAGCGYFFFRFFKRKAKTETVYLVFCTLAFILFYALFTRMRAFLAFFACLTSIVFLHKASEGRKHLFALLCMIVLGMESYHALSANASFFTRVFYGIDNTRAARKFSLYYENALLDAVRSMTQPQDVVLARWALSPMVHAYTNRSIVLHAFFESSDIREKTRMFNALLFSGEERLYKQCKTWGATVLILADNMLEENTVSERYMADIKTLKPSMAAVTLLNRKQSGTKHFQLIYESAVFRMFRVL